MGPTLIISVPQADRETEDVLAEEREMSILKTFKNNLYYMQSLKAETCPSSKEERTQKKGLDVDSRETVDCRFAHDNM